jgi:hypothetical protein
MTNSRKPCSEESSEEGFAADGTILGSSTTRSYVSKEASSWTLFLRLPFCQNVKTGRTSFREAAASNTNLPADQELLLAPLVDSFLQLAVPKGSYRQV